MAQRVAMGMFTPITWSRSPAKWLYITAVIELVVAGVFLYFGLTNPILEGGFVLTAGILGVVALGLLVWARKWGRAAADAERIKAQGVPGTATILGMRQTGMQLNDQPQIELRLQVSTQMHGAYEVNLKEWVPLMMLGVLSSGRPLPVKVDPANPQRVVIEWESAGGMGEPMAATAAGMPVGPAAAAGQMGYAAAAPADPADVKKRLLESGVSGTAKVISSAPTGQTDSEGRAVYSMMLEIHVEGRPPIQGPAVVGVPPERTEMLEPGDRVPIKADPSNPALMAVDWESA
ncbi:MAG: hypothetical protein ACRDHM_11240 [Actinomycetota bacterium]